MEGYEGVAVVKICVNKYNSKLFFLLKPLHTLLLLAFVIFHHIHRKLLSIHYLQTAGRFRIERSSVAGGGAPSKKRIASNKLIRHGFLNLKPPLPNSILSSITFWRD